MADIARTDYKDDILDTEQNTSRRYNMVSNNDGTISLEDVTVYLQTGDSMSAAVLNKIFDMFGGFSFRSLTQSEYDALETKDAKTIYFTTE